jgi:hypothetical protein
VSTNQNQIDKIAALRVCVRLGGMIDGSLGKINKRTVQTLPIPFNAVYISREHRNIAGVYCG